MRCPGWTILLVTVTLCGAQTELGNTSTQAAAAVSDQPQLAALVDVPLSTIVANATEPTEVPLEPTATSASNATTVVEQRTESQETISTPPSSSWTSATPTVEQPSVIPVTTITPSPVSSEAAEPSAVATESLPAPDEIPSPPADLPSPPEFLSFNEWREKYVVLPDPAARRKKGGQRGRQDGQGGVGVGGGGAAFDGDGADLGSLFTSEDGADLSNSDSGSLGGAAEDRPSASGSSHNAQGTVTDLGHVGRTAPSSSSSSSPLQPLPNVGTDDPSDPLLHLKDRSNYAAYECNAMVHRSSRQMKGATSILVEKKDRYMLTPCSAEPKFVEVELCDEIQIDTIVLASFELFSSMFKHFKMSCSVDYPGRPDSWHDLGHFRARNARGIQVFRTQAVPAFCRYVRINFLSHYGSEFYCPVSLFRVYGYTQMDAWRESERKKEEEARALEAALALEDDDDEEDELESIEPVVETHGSDKVEKAGEMDSQPDARDSTALATSVEHSETSAESSSGALSAESTLSPSSTAAAETTSLSTSISSPQTSSTVESSSTSDLSVSAEAPSSTAGAVPESTDAANSTPLSSIIPPSASPSSTVGSPPNNTVTSSPSQATTSQPASIETFSAANTTTATPVIETSTAISSSSSASSNASSAISPVSAASSASSVTVPSSSSASTTPTSARTSTTETPSSSPPVVLTRSAPRNDSYPPPPHRPIPPPSREPQPGESIYGTIMKRLASLEHNQTLAMHYIEAQSGMLREAFLRVEHRLGEVEGARTKQEHIFKQSLFELEKLRVELEKERLAFTSQVNQLAQDIRLEKRLSIAQLIGLLVTVLFVGFTRGSPMSPFLHLSSAQAIRAAAKEEAKRKAARMEEETESPSEVGPRRSSGYRANSLTIARVPSKRHSSALGTPKPPPRRHYGNGTSGATSTKAMSRSPRTWTPPPRHASAPPDDLFAASLSTALEGGSGLLRAETARRRGSKHAKYSHSISHSAGDPAVGLAISTGSPRSTSPLPPRAAGSGSHHLSRPFFPTRPSMADDADTEPSEMGGDPEEYSASDVPTAYRRGDLGSNGLPSGDTDGGYRTYSASEEEEDELRPPSPPLREGSSPFLKPPRPILGKRPVSSTGVLREGASSLVPFPTERDSPRRVLTPQINLPSPPPEPPSKQMEPKSVIE